MGFIYDYTLILQGIAFQQHKKICKCYGKIPNCKSVSMECFHSCCVLCGISCWLFEFRQFEWIGWFGILLSHRPKYSIKKNLISKWLLRNICKKSAINLNNESLKYLQQTRKVPTTMVLLGIDLLYLSEMKKEGFN